MPLTPLQLERRIFNAANTLRGPVDAADIKPLNISLLFMQIFDMRNIESKESRHGK